MQLKPKVIIKWVEKARARARLIIFSSNVFMIYRRSCVRDCTVYSVIEWLPIHCSKNSRFTINSLRCVLTAHCTTTWMKEKHWEQMCWGRRLNGPPNHFLSRIYFNHLSSKLWASHPFEFRILFVFFSPCTSSIIVFIFHVDLICIILIGFNSVAISMGCNFHSHSLLLNENLSIKFIKASTESLINFAFFRPYSTLLHCLRTIVLASAAMDFRISWMWIVFLFLYSSRFKQYQPEANYIFFNYCVSLKRKIPFLLLVQHISACIHSTCFDLLFNILR